jgi:beta-ureidopropionase / N-carbamoyl-L-amino-acid hydrolase
VSGRVAEREPHSRSIPEPDIGLAERLFDILRSETADTEGVIRAAYGDGEQFAHDLVTAEARKVRLETSVDAAGNLYIKLPGSAAQPRTIIIGSHLDSVPMGGNFDGAAGVLAGLAVIVSCQKAGFRLADNLVVMAIRAEESNWFPHSYIGSKAALGLLAASALEVRRSDTGRTLAEHMTALGFKPDVVMTGAQQIRPEDIRAYIEVHIEQGPILIEQNLPVGLVTGIRGSFRYREARVLGEYAHSGAVPRRYRHDAVIGAADLIMSLQEEWLRFEADGHDLVYTVGILSTDPAQHGFSKISGDVRLSIDVRSHEPATLERMQKRVAAIARGVEARHSVRIDLGQLTGSTPAIMDPALLDTFSTALERIGIPAFEMPCGAGHDAAVFAGAGVPTLMLFVRNQNGSHNPAEAMEIADFAAVTRVLAQGLALLP